MILCNIAKLLLKHSLLFCIENLRDKSPHLQYTKAIGSNILTSDETENAKAAGRDVEAILTQFFDKNYTEPLTDAEAAANKAAEVEPPTDDDIDPITPADTEPHKATNVGPSTPPKAEPPKAADAKALLLVDVDPHKGSDIKPQNASDIKPLKPADIDLINAADIESLKAVDIELIKATDTEPHKQISDLETRKMSDAESPTPANAEATTPADAKPSKVADTEPLKSVCSEPLKSNAEPRKQSDVKSNKSVESQPPKLADEDPPKAADTLSTTNATDVEPITAMPHAGPTHAADDKILTASKRCKQSRKKNFRNAILRLCCIKKDDTKPEIIDQKMLVAVKNVQETHLHSLVAERLRIQIQSYTSRIRRFGKRNENVLAH